MVSRRVAALSCAAVIVAGLMVSPPALACACGGIASPAEFGVFVAQEQAIVSRFNGQERIELRLGVESGTVEMGLVFPTPAPAEVSLGSAETFQQIEAATAPRIVIDNDWWDLPDVDNATGASAGGAGAAFTPQILSQVQLGPLQATTLRAEDAAGLADWLARNSYHISDAVTALLSGYIDRGWYFVAVKLTGDSALSGDLAPVQFTFTSDELIYPMELSRAARDSQFVRLYVFDEHRSRPAPLATPTRELEAPQTTYWAGPAPPELADRGRYLTALNLAFPNPAVDIPGDLTMVTASDDSDVQQEVHIEHVVRFAGLPAGWATLLGLILLSILYATIRRYMKRRPNLPTLPR